MFLLLFVFASVLARSKAAATHRTHGTMHEFDIVPRNFMFVLVEITRFRTHHFIGNSLQHKLCLSNRFRGFKFDRHSSLHYIIASPVSMANPRPILIHRSTGCSRMYPWPPKICTARSVTIMTMSAAPVEAR